MDMIKVQIISTETIKPFPWTPSHLKTFNLSLIDQFAPPVYVPILLFYSPTDDLKNHRKRWSDHLKKSLSKTLAHFYPFAGQINKDALTIDCNDRGATYIEAQIEADMSDVVLKEPAIDTLQRLLPYDPLEKFADPSSRVILVVQVNYFACGGMAIGVCISHVIADASATASFVKSWAAIASGVNDIDSNGVIYDCSSLFPPHDPSELLQLMGNKMKMRYANCVTKRFLFDGSKIAALRNKISMEEEECFYRPTRVEAVSALIWRAVMAMEKDASNIPMHVASFPVNLRKIMNPVLPELCIGNVYQITMATSMMEKNVKHSSLAGKIHESIKRIKDEYARKRGEYLNMMFGKNNADELKNGLKEIVAFAFSSWCRFPFYETDFGWGKPVWVGTALRMNRLAILLDSSDGQGIEAWIGLTEEEMAKLEQDPEILAHASFGPSRQA